MLFTIQDLTPILPISDDGKIKMTGLTESTAVIAIDKHGNESKLLIIKE
jgi:hypothetical protein